MATQGRLDTRHTFPSGALTDDDKYKFVNLDGSDAALAGAGELAYILLAVEGPTATVALDNKQKVELGANVTTALTPLAADASGLAVPAIAGDVVNAIALDTGVTGDVLPVFVVHYEI